MVVVTGFGEGVSWGNLSFKGYMVAVAQDKKF